MVVRWNRAESLLPNDSREVLVTIESEYKLGKFYRKVEIAYFDIEQKDFFERYNKYKNILRSDRNERVVAWCDLKSILYREK